MSVSARDLRLELARGVIEALLFAAPQPLSIAELAGAAGLEETVVRHALAALEREYAAPGRGVRLERIAGGYQLLTRPEFAPAVERLGRSRSQPQLSRAALETLAIIAYHQPVTRAEIESIRGVRSDATLTTLIERGLVAETGRRAGVGRPILYGTTREFLCAFGLPDLEALPPWQEEADRESAPE